MLDVRVYIVRHGETTENRMGIIQGQLDTELNDEGKRQAQVTALALKNEAFNLAFSSDSHRAMDTASAILAYHPEVKLIPQPLLRERFMGELQGKRGIKGGRGLPDSAEKGEVFRKRALQWWDTDIKTLIPSSESSPDLTEDDTPTPTLPLRVLIVSHGAFIHTLVDALRNDGNLQHLPHLEVNRPRIYNTSISEIRYDSNGKLWTLWRYADINHLLTPSNVVKDNADETG